MLLFCLRPMTGIIPTEFDIFDSIVFTFPFSFKKKSPLDQIKGRIGIIIVQPKTFYFSQNMKLQKSPKPFLPKMRVKTFATAPRAEVRTTVVLSGSDAGL